MTSMNVAILILSACVVVILADIPEHDPLPNSDGKFLFTKKCPFTYCSSVCPDGFERNVWGCLFCKCKKRGIFLPGVPAPEPDLTLTQPAPGAAKIIYDERTTKAE